MSMTSSDPIQTPLPVPTHPNAAPLDELAEIEQTAYDRVLAHFSKPEYVVPGVEPGEGALMEAERMWLSCECIRRFLRATKYDASESIKRLEGTLKWRRDFGLYTFITPEHVEPEAATGKLFAFGYDTRGKPGLYMSPGGFADDEGPRQILFLFWFFERIIELMGPGVETLSLMIDYENKTKNPSLSTAIQVVTTVQTHYPERLGATIFAHLPWILNTFFKLLNPFMDVVTRSKLIFGMVVDDAGLWRSAQARDQGHEHAKLFELDQLPINGWSGTVPFTYNHDVYWPAFLSMTEARRDDLMRVWRDLGGTIGIKEWDVKIGVRDGSVVPGATDGTDQT